MWLISFLLPGRSRTTLLHRNYLSLVTRMCLVMAPYSDLRLELLYSLLHIFPYLFHDSMPPRRQFNTTVLQCPHPGCKRTCRNMSGLTQHINTFHCRMATQVIPPPPPHQESPEWSELSMTSLSQHDTPQYDETVLDWESRQQPASREYHKGLTGNFNIVPSLLCIYL